MSFVSRWRGFLPGLKACYFGQTDTLANSIKNQIDTSDFTSCQGYPVGGVFLMNVTQITENGIVATEVPKPTNQEMQNEYDYILSEQMTKNLLSKGLITEDEYEQIMAKNRVSFCPFISKIMQK